ncbi:hypothetical protein [Paenibacillus sp. L3-i20]|uniref:hypothetical protein n=1 Tax=Paenibacillus sp. L3-i20 TaxID=2905833 RepID=UPI001EDDE5CD|nr:hypothetical protein [Paenibacillus sp. L3-i20]GKU79314.1 hypothetical protein L3i20_v237110 [Paenibacillus sp. L3-i20]
MDMKRFASLTKAITYFPLAAEIRRQEAITLRLLQLSHRTGHDMKQLTNELRQRTIASPLRAEDMLEIMYEEYSSEQLALVIKEGALVVPGRA